MIIVFLPIFAQDDPRPPDVLGALPRWWSWLIWCREIAWFKPKPGPPTICAPSRMLGWEVDSGGLGADKQVLQKQIMKEDMNCPDIL